MSSFNYRSYSICKVRYECALSCRDCKYYQSKDCENMIASLQEEAERMEANYERLRQNNLKQFPHLSGKA